MPQLPPMRFELEIWGDLAFESNSDVLVSRQFKDAFLASGLTGISGFSRAEIVKVVARRGRIPDPMPEYFAVVMGRSRAAIDDRASGTDYLKRWTCDECRIGNHIRLRRQTRGQGKMYSSRVVSRGGSSRPSDSRNFATDMPLKIACSSKQNDFISTTCPIERCQIQLLVEDGEIGFDPAWLGDDRHAMAWRRVEKVEARASLDTMAAAGWLKQVIENDKPKRVFIDVGGVGAGIYDRLREMGFGQIVRAVNFGSAPLEPPPLDERGNPSGGPLNRRAEMWMKSREWLEDPAGAAIPDRDSLQADACGPTYSYDSNSRLKLESKDHMRARGVRSPDEWDAVALTFPEVAGFRRRIAYPRSGVGVTGLR
jgi:hypothetical protein